MPFKILVADDDEDNRAIMAAALSQAGYEVRHARDGLQALEAAAREAPDLILMDLSMPLLSGWEAVRRLKADAALRRIPVFAFTAYALAGDAEKAKQAGCEGYISKPCVPSDAVHTIALWLSGRRGGS